MNSPLVLAGISGQSARHAPGIERANGPTILSSAASASSQPASNSNGGVFLRLPCAFPVLASLGKIAGRYSCLRTVNSRAATARLQNLRSCPMRMDGLLAACCKSCDVSRACRSGATTASTRQVPLDVTSGISPSRSACSSRDGVGLAPSPGKVAQTLVRALEGIPESWKDGKTVDTVLARSVDRS